MAAATPKPLAGSSSFSRLPKVPSLLFEVDLDDFGSEAAAAGDQGPAPAPFISCKRQQQQQLLEAVPEAGSEQQQPEAAAAPAPLPSPATAAPAAAPAADQLLVLHVLLELPLLRPFFDFPFWPGFPWSCH